LAISEYDEFPEQNSFEISVFYNPKLSKYEMIEDRIFKLTISYSPYQDRKEKTFEFSSDYLSGSAHFGNFS